MQAIKKANVIATVCYADIFDYPLTPREAHTWLLFGGSVPKTKKEYIYLENRKHIVAQRVAKHVWQEEKWNIARKAAKLLSLVPTITLVGVTGGLSMNNARRVDDIDLFCITSAGTLWISRFFATILMDVAGMRRHPGQTQVSNKVCLNMFMSQNAMHVPANEQDCFSAHEVLQMTPLWETRGTYRMFLLANRWAQQFLPNAWQQKRKATVNQAYASIAPVVWIFRLFEFPSRVLQLWYMKRRRTREVVTNTVLRFHPNDARVWVKRRFAERLDRFNIPLDKFFYGS